MPTLTRRRDLDAQDEWHVYYGDVRAGTISKRIGIPPDEDPWGLACGFYRAAISESKPTKQHRQSTRRALSSRKRGRFSSPIEPRPIFRKGARSKPSPHGNIACGIPGTGCQHNRRTAGQPAFAAPASRSATCPTTSVAHIWKRLDEIRR